MTDYERIAQAIEFFIERCGEQPSVESVAAHVGMSRFHFQRVFKQYAGVTPKQFLAAITLEYAKPLLEKRAVLEAALETGLSSPARLHDHFVTIDAMSPGDYKRGGAGMDVLYGFARTPIGLIRVLQTARGIAMLDFVESMEPLDVRETPLPKATFAREDRVAETVAERAFRGGDPLRLHVHGTNFQLRVWHALLAIEPGERVSYAQLANAIGAPRAARAVGNALAENPVGLLIPCHRVIQGSGAIGQYKWGAHRKQALLTLERALRPSGSV